MVADDPLTVINNLSTFIFGLIRAIGMILLGTAKLCRFGLSLKSHDQSQSEPMDFNISRWLSLLHFAKRNPESDYGYKEQKIKKNGTVQAQMEPHCPS